MSVMEIPSYMMTVAYVIGFLAMSVILAKDAGRPVWLFNKGREKQAVPAALFRLAFVGAVAWPIALTLLGNPIGTDPVSKALDGSWFDVLGHLLVVVGACLAMLSQAHMGTSWRIGAAEGELGPIVDTGPFAFSRNPVFVGQAMLFIGLFIVLPSLIQAGLTLALLIAIILQVRIEERVLDATLGQPYRDYKMRVRRWFGTRNSPESPKA